jgi:hypothetical protein
MRIVAVFLAFFIVAFAALTPAADAGWIPYVELGRQYAPWVAAGLALLLFVLLLFWNPRAAVRTVAAPVAPAPKPVKPDADVVNFLGLLQEKGRFVDFLMGDIAKYSDAEVGAAGRVLHEGCKAVINEHFGVKPLREEAEGAKVTVPQGYAPDDYRLVGRISGEAPFKGTLIHHGWRAEWVKLPRLIRNSDDKLPAIAPAEVELG